MYRKIKSFLFENQTAGQTVAKNVTWLAGSAIIGRLARGAMIIYAARVLGTEGYGIFSYALSVAAFFAIFADIGLTGLLTREAAKKPERLSEYVSTVALFKLALVVATAVVVIGIAPFFVKIDAARTLLPIVAFILVLDNLRSFSFSIARANHRMEIEGILDMATELFITGLGFAVLFWWPNTTNLALSYALGGLVGLTVVILTIRKQFQVSLKNFNKRLLGPIFSASWPFAMLAVFSTFMTNIDSIILGWYQTARDLGLFAAAFRPVAILYLLPGFLGSGLAPLFSQMAHHEKHNSMKEVLGKVLALTIGLALPLTVGGIILAPSIISLLFGGDYVGSVTTFRTLLVTLLFVFPGTIISTAIYALNLQKTFIRASGLGAVMNIVLDLLLIPGFGILGSAVATVIAQGCMNSYNAWSLKQAFGFSLLHRLPKFISATVIMAVALMVMSSILHWYILIIVAVGVLIYIATLLLLKEKLVSDMRSIFRT
jgi:O-antigen/teichoic acid export membrane protein